MLHNLKLAVAVAIGLTAAPVSAEPELPAPSGEVVLRVTGDIGATNVGDEAHFDRAMLEKLTREAFSTSTVWTDGTPGFEGASLKALLDLLEVEDGTIKAIAMNDYSVEIPVSDAKQNGPILADRFNGEPMTVRNKGPLWIVYPFDHDKDYQSEVVFSRSIWQLNRMDISR